MRSTHTHTHTVHYNLFSLLHKQQYYRSNTLSYTWLDISPVAYNTCKWGWTADMWIKYLEVTVRAGKLVAVWALHIFFSIPAQTADLSYFLPSRHAISLTGIMWSELLYSETTKHEFNQAWLCRTEQAHKYCSSHDMDVIYSLVQQLKNYTITYIQNAIYNVTDFMMVANETGVMFLEIQYSNTVSIVLNWNNALYIYIYIYTGWARRNVPDFGRVFLMLKHNNITQKTYIQSWTVMEIMAWEVWNFDSCYTLIDYQIHIKTGRNMLFL